MESAQGKGGPRRAHGRAVTRLPPAGAEPGGGLVTADRHTEDNRTLLDRFGG
ncbi:hypothetical protein AB0F13_00205 [Streptomyces sp. NPDC026206]|uniref:hypothetical protein n=1 Tax=Streptomyces sp. NPDC026206 TaxID=3157089 RepID=UPI0033FA0684